MRHDQRRLVPWNTADELLFPAPLILCTNYADQFKLLDDAHFQAQSICFHPKFINRSLDYQTLKEDQFEELNEQHLH